MFLVFGLFLAMKFSVLLIGEVKKCVVVLLRWLILVAIVPYTIDEMSPIDNFDIFSKCILSTEDEDFTFNMYGILVVSLYFIVSLHFSK